MVEKKEIDWWGKSNDAIAVDILKNGPYLTVFEKYSEQNIDIGKEMGDCNIGDNIASVETIIVRTAIECGWTNSKLLRIIGEIRTRY